MQTGFAFQPTVLIDEEADFLPVDQAFKVNVLLPEESAILFEIEPGYYMYKKAFKFSVVDAQTGDVIENAVTATPPTGKSVQDPYFGEVQIYEFQVLVPVVFNQAVLAQHKGKELQLKYRYQGCATAGLCYPPKTKKFTLPNAIKGGVSAINKKPPPKKTSAISPAQKSQPSSEGFFLQLKNAQDIEKYLLAEKGILSLLVFLLLGLGLAFTPCVLPMVPIISGIVLANEKMSTQRSFILSVFYVLGMAFTYAVLGLVVAYFGAKANVQLYMQQPWVIFVMAALFFVLALSLFDVYELKMPAFIQNKFNEWNQKTQGGSLLGVTIMGALSALVVSPCVSAPLAGVLLFIASSGDMLFGALALFFLALGMGIPLIVIGTMGNKFFPKSGAWLNTVKKVLGFLMIAVALWLLERILPGWLSAAAWLIWSVLLAILLFMNKATHGFGKLLGMALALLALAYGLNKAYSGAMEFLQAGNVNNTNASTIYIELVNTDNVVNVIQQQGDHSYTILDVYADWCVSCKIMEDKIFKQESVHQTLPKVRFLKIDASHIDDSIEKFFVDYDIKGLPNIIIFDAQGNEVEPARILGEMNREQFMQHMQKYTQ